MTVASTPTQAEVLPLERLSESELRSVKRLRDLCQIAGVLLGAVRGHGGSWDVRPVIQTTTGTVVVRTVDPELALDSTRSRQNNEGLRATLRAWRDSPLVADGFSFSEEHVAGQIWVARRWYDQLNTVGPNEAGLNEVEFLQLVAGLVSLHGGGVGHGNLVGSNIVRTDNGMRVLDPGLRFFSELDAASRDARAKDLAALVPLAPISLQARAQSAVTTGRLAALTGMARPAVPGSMPGTFESAANTGSGSAEKTAVNEAGGVRLSQRLSGAPGFPGSLSPVPLFAGYRKLLFVSVLIVASLAGAWVWFAQEREIIPIADATQFIASGQPSLLGKVAEAAVLGQRSAQALIVQAASEGKIPEALYNRRLIRIGFDARWEAQLSDSDREIALRLGLSTLYPAGLTGAPPFSGLHPAVLLAVIADIDERKSAAFADNISIEGFSRLPGEVGAAFTALRSAEVTQLSDPSARALARIVGNGIALTATVDVAQGEDRDVQLVLSGKGAGARLRALIALFDAQPKLARTVLSTIAAGSGVLTELLRWLGSDFSAGWGKAPPQIVLGILAGMPPKSLGLEQWADLLSFPEPGVRRAAAVALAERFLKNDAEMLTLFASTDLGLSRVQTTTLVTAMGLPAEEQYTLLSRWVASNPGPAALKSLLLLRSSAPLNDAFNLEAARTLSNSQIQFSNLELRRLVLFKETLVRAMAYGRLTVEDPEQRKILEEGAQQDLDQTLRNALLERLSEHTRTQAALSR